MTDITVHALDAVTPLGTDELYITRSPFTSGNDYKITWSSALSAVQTASDARYPQQAANDARYVPFVASAGITINAGSGGSGNLVFQTHGVEAFKIIYPDVEGNARVDSTNFRLTVSRVYSADRSDYMAYFSNFVDLPVQVTDGVMSSTVNPTKLNSASGTFISDNIIVGQYITVAGAGPGGALLRTTVTARNSATQLTLANAASTTVSGASVSYWTASAEKQNTLMIMHCRTGGYNPDQISSTSPSVHFAGPQAGNIHGQAYIDADVGIRSGGVGTRMIDGTGGWAQCFTAEAKHFKEVGVESTAYGGLVAIEATVFPETYAQTAPYSSVDGTANLDMTVNLWVGSRGSKRATAAFVMHTSTNGWQFGHYMQKAGTFIQMRDPIANDSIGINMLNDSTNHYWGDAMRIPNDARIAGYRSSGGTRVNLISLDANNVVQLGGVDESGADVEAIGVINANNSIKLPNDRALKGLTSGGLVRTLTFVNTAGVVVFGDTTVTSTMRGTSFIVAAPTINVEAVTSIVFDDTAGTKIGTSVSQKFAFWGADPHERWNSTTTASATFVSHGGTTITTTDTFDGYTLRQIVRGLRAMGLLT